MNEAMDELLPLDGDKRAWAITVFKSWHYAHSVPSGKTYYFCCHGVFFAFSIPANQNIAKYLLGDEANEKNSVYELSRMWANDDHGKNALTKGLSAAVKAFRKCEPRVKALVSYADPNVGHHGGVYLAASWVPVGRSEEGRYYRDLGGQVVSRRKFHSGGSSMTKKEIEALGFIELKLPGKIRFAKGFFPKSKKAIELKRQKI